MRDSTDAWLRPLQNEAERRGINIGALMKQASMPLQEADWVMIGKLHFGLAEVKDDVPGAERRAVDWIKFGQLLRAELGWTDYPEWPQEEEMPP